MSNARILRRGQRGLLIALALVLAAPMTLAAWVEFTNETGSRFPSGSLGSNDGDEKDFAWGDVDNDGDVDLVIVRKQEWTSAGKRVNVLLINEDGVLVNRTTEFASDSDVGGDDGFDTPTNDRDVLLADLNNDGWLDIVTATTISFGDPKHIGHPRIYMNQGCSGACEGTDDWNGFRFENARIPQMQTWIGTSNVNPCFCSVAAGDVNNDGWVDLYFGDYDSGGGGAVGTCGSNSNDFNDKLLLNQGAGNPGFFTDVTNSRFSGTVPGIGSEFPESAFGAAVAIADMNGDDIADVVKQTSLTPPQYVGMAINEVAPTGFFDTFDATYTVAPYFVSVDDVNNDLRLDMVITDDGADRYLINQGNGANSVPDFFSQTFDFTHSSGLPFEAAGDQGFGGNSVIFDMDNDGWKDVLIADADVDIPGCSRRMSIYRNLAEGVGQNITLEEQTEGSGCPNFNGNPSSCTVASIPANMLEGVHDVAIFDLNGDTWLDMVLGRCSSTEVWINTPPGGPVGGVPDGDEIPGSQLTVDKFLNGSEYELTLSWDDSCVMNDSDYGIYEGRIGSWYTHSRKICTTGGSTTTDIVPGAGVIGTYYLVVPTNSLTEGGYGDDSTGAARPTGAVSCHPQNIGSCDP